MNRSFKSAVVALSRGLLAICKPSVIAREFLMIKRPPIFIGVPVVVVTVILFNFIPWDIRQ